MKRIEIKPKYTKEQEKALIELGITMKSRLPEKVKRKYLVKQKTGV